MPPYCKNNETPIAVIKAAIRVALRKGLYAIRSMTTPKMAATIIAKSSAGKNGKCKTLVANHPAYAPTIIISPCAKLINLIIP